MSGEAKLLCFIAAYVAIGWLTAFVAAYVAKDASTSEGLILWTPWPCGLIAWTLWPFVWIAMLLAGVILGICCVTAFCLGEIEFWAKKYKSKTSVRWLCKVVRFVFMPWEAGKALRDKIKGGEE